MDSVTDCPFIIQNGTKIPLSENADAVVGKRLVVHRWTNDGINYDQNFWLVTHRQIGTVMAWTLSKDDAMQIATNLSRSGLNLAFIAKGKAAKENLPLFYDQIANLGGTWRDGVRIVIEKIVLNEEYLDKALEGKNERQRSKSK